MGITVQRDHLSGSTTYLSLFRSSKVINKFQAGYYVTWEVLSLGRFTIRPTAYRRVTRIISIKAAKQASHINKSKRGTQFMHAHAKWLPLHFIHKFTFTLPRFCFNEKALVENQVAIAKREEAGGKSRTAQPFSNWTMCTWSCLDMLRSGQGQMDLPRTPRDPLLPVQEYSVHAGTSLPIIILD